jgi:predicted XRE-type DNA-binding protein
MAQHEIAATLGVNQGRVSEVVNGARFADVAPEESTERH